MQLKTSILKEVETFLLSQKVDFNFYYENLQTGDIFEAGTRMRFPFGSCFKLGVLGAALETFTNEELTQQIQITDKDVPKLAMGVLNYLDAPVSLTISNLIRLMMAFSDSASTDALIKCLGLEKVQRFTEKFTEESSVRHNVSDLLSILLKASIDVAENSKSITRKEYRRALELTTMREDYSNAKDLCSLLKGVLQCSPLAKNYLFRDQGVQRLGMYSLDNVRLYGKTGTLGYWVSANDCAVIVVDGEPKAVVGLMTLGWENPRYLIEHAFGKVGLMVSNLHREEPIYSPAFGTE